VPHHGLTQLRAPVVLIVEDEFLIRAATADAIRDAGFEVLEAGNADEALVSPRTRSDFRVVFTDKRMPGSMNGAHLAHATVSIMATSGKVALQTLTLPGGTLLFPSHTPQVMSPGLFRRSQQAETKHVILFGGEHVPKLLPRRAGPALQLKLGIRHAACRACVDCDTRYESRKR
jgi:hypothetical protein